MIDYCIGRSADENGPSHEWFTPPSPNWFASCAASEHPLLQRIAATYRLLPDEVLERLLTDPDRAQAAASNAGLSAERQHDLLTRAGIPRRGRTAPNPGRISESAALTSTFSLAWVGDRRFGHVVGFEGWPAYPEVVGRDLAEPSGGSAAVRKVAILVRRNAPPE
jgi:hypothetical protein